MRGNQLTISITIYKNGRVTADLDDTTAFSKRAKYMTNRFKYLATCPEDSFTKKLKDFLFNTKLKTARSFTNLKRITNLVLASQTTQHARCALIVAFVDSWVAMSSRASSLLGVITMAHPRKYKERLETLAVEHE